MEDDDLDFAEVPKREVRQGRRARPDAVEDDTSHMNGDIPPRPSKRTAGWGEDRLKKKSPTEPEDDRLKQNAHDDDSSELDLPVIPDLDDVQEADMANQIAQAPSVTVNRVATYKELDYDLLKHAAFLTLDNETDLKVLAKALHAETEVLEPDQAWEWERLFTEVSSELHQEWDKDLEVSDEEETN